MSEARYDAVVVGSGPNGLAAAVALARAKWKVLVIEGRDTVGGGCRTGELTLPGFQHDVCSAIHPLAASSPFLTALPLEEHGLTWIQPELPLVQVLEDGRAAVLYRSVDETAGQLGRDGRAWRWLFDGISRNWSKVAEAFLGPLGLRHPVAMARFGIRALWSAQAISDVLFEEEPARALFAGMAAHSFMALDAPTTAAFGLMLGASGHAVGWPVAKGGSQAIADALASYLRALGGEIQTGRFVESLDELPTAKAVLLDVTPRQLLALAKGRPMRSGYRLAMEHFRYGPAAFKLDYALSGPIPWRAPECARTATVHLGATFDEIAASERAVVRGEIPERPYVLVAQQSLVDASRAPEGRHTAWVYCHVPTGSTVDMTSRIEAQLERFAPGFSQRVLARTVRTPAQLEAYNPNAIGGDISAGAVDGLQMFVRPVAGNPYRTALPGVYLCSASTAPGPGVHGMCGYYAAQTALRDLRA